MQGVRGTGCGLPLWRLYLRGVQGKLSICVFVCVPATKRDQGWSSICLVREDVVRGVAFSSTSNWHRFSVDFGIQIKLLSGKKLRIRNDKARARSSEKEKIMWTILYLAMLGPIYLAVITLSR